jgi:hypothetical protein
MSKRRGNLLREISKSTTAKWSQKDVKIRIWKVAYTNNSWKCKSPKENIEAKKETFWLCPAPAGKRLPVPGIPKTCAARIHVEVRKR